jgi:hypothetical protein
MQRIVVEDSDPTQTGGFKMPVLKDGNRVYFYFPYNDELKNALKDYGAKWDKEAKGWWTTERNKNYEKMCEAYQQHAGWTENVVTFDFEYGLLTADGRNNVTDVIKELGAQWCNRHRAWIVPEAHENLEKIRSILVEAKEQDVVRNEQNRAKNTELDRRKKEVGPLSWSGKIPNHIVAALKESDGMFDGRQWFMPDMASREHAERQLWDWDQEKRDEKAEKWADCHKITVWTQWKNECKYTVGMVVTVRDIDKLPGCVTGDKVRVVHIDRQFTRDGMSFGAPNGMDDAWLHTVYLRKEQDT